DPTPVRPGAAPSSTDEGTAAPARGSCAPCSSPNQSGGRSRRTCAGQPGPGDRDPAPPCRWSHGQDRSVTSFPVRRGWPWRDSHHQLLQCQPSAVGAGLGQIAGADHGRVQRPAEGGRALAQRVLSLGTLGILEHLAQRALAYIQVGLALQVGGGDLVVQPEVHDVNLLLWQPKAISVSRCTTSPPRPTGGAWWCAAIGVCGTAGASGAQVFIQSGKPAARNSARPRGVTAATSPVACARSAS